MQRWDSFLADEQRLGKQLCGRYNAGNRAKFARNHDLEILKILLKGSADSVRKSKNLGRASNFYQVLLTFLTFLSGFLDFGDPHLLEFIISIESMSKKEEIPSTRIPGF